MTYTTVVSIPPLNPEQLIPRKRLSMDKAPWRVATRPVYWYNGSVLPAGTEYKAFETRNFGWVILRNPVGGRMIGQF